MTLRTFLWPSHADAMDTALERAEDLMGKNDFARVLYEQSVLLEDPPNDQFRASLEAKLTPEQRDEVTRRIEQWKAENAKKP
jgi:hypothetical protein